MNEIKLDKAYFRKFELDHLRNQLKNHKSNIIPISMHPEHPCFFSDGGWLPHWKDPNEPTIVEN